jgi:probable F420-dependent oxidoreductase
VEFGLVFANTGPYVQPDGAVALARAAEAAGFDSLWTVEHVLVPVGYESEYPYDPSGKMPGGNDSPIPDPLIWLAYLAQATSTIKLGTGVLIVPQRNPGVLAKELATLDMLSKGRMLCGVGSGWLEEEFDALGVPFERRGQRLDAYIEALRVLWADDSSTIDNEFVSFTDVMSFPKPVDRNIPIIIGGHTKIAAKRAGRLGDGFFPAKGDTMELMQVMREAAVEAGRDPADIEMTAGAPPEVFGEGGPEKLAELEAAGVSRVVIPPLSYNPAKIGDVLGAFGEKVIKPSRA